MPEDDDLDFALREARDRGDHDRVRQLEKQRAQRAKEKEKLKLDVLKQQLKQDDVKKPGDRTMVTMTRDQEEKGKVITAQEKPTPEHQIDDAKRQEDVKKNTPEFQQDLG